MRTKIFKIVLLIVLFPAPLSAYDFVADGVYYAITSRLKRTVEVTHWEERTNDKGRPQRVMHHHDCEHNHENEPLSNRHRKLIQMDEDAVERERTAYIGKVIVPVTVRYRGIRYTVTGVGKGSFWGRNQLTEIDLPESIQYIEDAAFEKCTGLTRMRIPSSVTRIGFAAFRHCDQLREICLPSNLQTLDSYTFAFCENLKELVIPSSVKAFYGNVVFHCVRLKRIILPHDEPPLMTNDFGLKMDFRNIVFFVPYQVMPLYQDSEFWRTLHIQALTL